jgi:hypothetical protein
LAELTAKLIRYAWKEQDNRVVFDCLKRLTSAKNIMPSQLREQLPAQATRMGFPDVKWENYIGQERADQETADQETADQETADQPDIRNLVEQLLAAS